MTADAGGTGEGHLALLHIPNLCIASAYQLTRASLPPRSSELKSVRMPLWHDRFLWAREHCSQLHAPLPG